ncbi:MAG: glycosyltransferase [Baekduia sp.]
MNVCTIVAKNYVAFARVLATSLREQHPDSTLTVLVLDDYDGFIDPDAEPFELITPFEIGCEAFPEMADRYSVLELSTAVKPWLLETLLDRDGYDHAIYLDPDIQVVGSLDPIAEAAERHGVALTPHTLSPIPRDGRYPQEQSLLVAGAYNLGFIALGDRPAARELLEWWQHRLERDCVVDVANGLFVDQKWIDLVPGLWPGTHLLTDPGCNVAYWNYHERELGVSEDGGVTVNGSPGRFLHFSGYDPLRPRLLSKYQNRIELRDRPDIKQAADRYGNALLAADYETTTAWPYGISRLGIGSSGTDVPGVNVAGYLTAELGVGEVGRQVIRSLDAADVPVVPIPVLSGTNRELSRFEHSGSGGDLQPVNLLCVNADMLPEVAEQIGRDILEERRTIGFWWWETETFPRRWRPSLDLVDEVWVGSRFVADAVSLVTTKPVVHIPTPVTVPAATKPDRAGLKLPDGFLFLFVFDFNSVAKRKNPIGLVEAFKRAFPDERDGVTLIIKAINGDRHPLDQAALADAIGDRSDVLLIDHYLSADARDALVASCDCYVSLHRSEGFGLTIAEAMLLGKPVIATDYGGSCDIVHEETAFPVRWERTQVGEGAAPYAPDEFWAEPDSGHAAELMRLVVDDPEVAAMRAARGREHVLAGHSPEAAGLAMAERLRHVGASRNARTARATAPEAVELPDAELARAQTLDVIRASGAASRRPRALARRLTRLLTRGEAATRRESDEALWWSIEASSVVAAERLDEAVRTVQRQEKAILALERQLDLVRSDADELRAHVAELRIARRRSVPTENPDDARATP